MQNFRFIGAMVSEFRFFKKKKKKKKNVDNLTSKLKILQIIMWNIGMA